MVTIQVISLTVQGFGVQWLTLRIHIENKDKVKENPWSFQRHRHHSPFGDQTRTEPTCQRHGELKNPAASSGECARCEFSIMVARFYLCDPISCVLKRRHLQGLYNLPLSISLYTVLHTIPSFEKPQGFHRMDTGHIHHSF